MIGAQTVRGLPGAVKTLALPASNRKCTMTQIIGEMEFRKPGCLLDNQEQQMNR